ncbi:MAG: 30S ribosomal protein THX [Gammaproteobacteria bacterium]
MTPSESSMGKGDKKSARGKVWRGSYGNSRPHRPAKKQGTPASGRQPAKRK